MYYEIRRGEGLVWAENLISGQCSGGGGGGGGGGVRFIPLLT